MHITQSYQVITIYRFDLLFSSILAQISRASISAANIYQIYWLFCHLVIPFIFSVEGICCKAFIKLLISFYLVSAIEAAFLFRHLLQTFILLPSPVIKSYKTFILVVLHTGQFPLPRDGNFNSVFPLYCFVAMTL